jgi:outer membrane lipoprotein-sorting protein
MKRTFAAFAALLAVVTFAPAANAAAALDEAAAAFTKINDYVTTVVVHETDNSGKNVEDRTYKYSFMKPSFVKLEILAGSHRGAGVVWRGGDKVKGHDGGFLSGIHLTLDIHNGRVVSLRGDTVDSGTIPAMLDQFKTIKGDVSEVVGPTIEGQPTDVVTLKVADPTTDDGVSKIVLYLSKTTHLPVRRERFVGDQLVKLENVTSMKTNVGLTENDFPF